MATSPQANPLYALSPSQVNRSESAQWRQIVSQALTEARCASPAFMVEDMDAATQTVTVQLAIQERVRTATGPQWWDVPQIVKVPVLLPRGGGFALTLPLKKGTEGLLIFCDACFDNWWANGQANSPVAANTGVASGSQRQNEVRRHYLHDCGFFPGMWSQPNVLSDYSTDAAQIRSEDAADLLEVRAGEVNAKASSSVGLTAPTITASNGGAALPLVNDNFYQWFVDVYMPSVMYTGSMPAPPTDPETTVLKGQ